MPRAINSANVEISTKTANYRSRNGNGAPIEVHYEDHGTVDRRWAVPRLSPSRSVTAAKSPLRRGFSVQNDLLLAERAVGMERSLDL
jgi:hypothetical protein